MTVARLALCGVRTIFLNRLICGEILQYKQCVMDIFSRNIEIKNYLFADAAIWL
jgi:hypothetical protein